MTLRPRFLLIVLVLGGVPPSASAAADRELAGGPPVDTAADLVVDDFEAELAWHAVKQGNVETELDRRLGLGHTGQASLLVTVKAGPVEKGRNAVRLQRALPQGLDASGYEGVQFWIKPVAGATELKCCLHLPRGVRYRTSVEFAQQDEGQWTFVRIPFRRFQWDFESAKTGAQTPDRKSLAAISLWLSSTKPGETVFYLDDLGLYREKPPYAGPTIRLRSSIGKAIAKPGDKLAIAGRVERLPKQGEFALKLRLDDYFGKRVLDKVLSVEADSRGEFAFEVPCAGLPYARLAATLTAAGNDVYTQTYSVATIAPLAPGERRARSPFGIWVGGVTYLMEQGGDWFRTYCEPWQFEPDGQGAYRYIGKGTFPRPMPFPGTPICYFRGMPKWLTSRPDRVDYQKFPPKDWDEYARFVTWYVGRMKPYIKHWEVWNEPVPYAYWMGTIEDMVRLHEVTYKAVKAADPEAIVLGPCPYSFLFPFLEKFFELGGGQWIDAVVIHAYTSGAPEPGQLDVNLQKVRQLAARFVGPRDLYVTELGWDAGRIGWTRQAQYLVRSHVLALEARVKALIWHMYWNYGEDGPGGYALLNHNHTPRPGLVAYCQMMRMLRETTFSRRLGELTDPQRAYEFAGPRGRVIVAWCWEGSRAAKIPLGAERAELVDMMGQSRPLTVCGGAAEVVLDENPIYLLIPGDSGRKR